VFRILSCGKYGERPRSTVNFLSGTSNESSGPACEDGWETCPVAEIASATTADANPRKTRRRCAPGTNRTIEAAKLTEQILHDLRKLLDRPNAEHTEAPRIFAHAIEFRPPVPAEELLDARPSPARSRPFATMRGFG